MDWIQTDKKSVTLWRLTPSLNKLIDKANSLPLDFARTTQVLNSCHESLSFKQALP